MVQTRAQKAAQKRDHPDDEDPSPPTNKRPRREACHNAVNRQPVQEKSPKGIREDTPGHQYPPASGPSAVDNIFDTTTVNDADRDNPIEFWIKEGRWPSYLFELPIYYRIMPKRAKPFAGGDRMSTTSALTGVTPSDQKPRELKSTSYTRPQYDILLMTKGFYRKELPQGMDVQSEQICQELLDGLQPTPVGTFFDDAVFQKTCEELVDQNEAMVIRDISQLIAPSAQGLARWDDNSALAVLKESVNQGWNTCVPLTEPRPQPDYSVGFGYEAFTSDEHSKLAPFVGQFLAGDKSFFMATWYMYFPFFTCEVKCGSAALEVADRQNAHSMTIAVRGIVELFRIAGRLKEVNRRVLAFSISHDHDGVRIFAHYAVVDGDPKYYRRRILKYSLSELNGVSRWAAYMFTKNVYYNWMPKHLEMIRSAINKLPTQVDFDVGTRSRSTGLSLGVQRLGASESNLGSLHRDREGQQGETGVYMRTTGRPDTNGELRPKRQRRILP